MKNAWLKPIFIVLAIFGFLVLLMNIGDVFPDVNWSAINNTVIPIMPWVVALGVALFVFMYVVKK